MTRPLTVSAVQFAPTTDKKASLEAAADFTREAASAGANVILLPELFDGPYFCKTQEEEHFADAAPWQTHPTVAVMAPLAKEYNVVLPVSIFEKDGPHYYNSIVMIDAGGELLGRYQKSHIPDGPGYQEKYYFRPGTTGFRTWPTKLGRIGVGICWDQWFPEAARAMVLQGAELLLYPTAIGAEPQDPNLDTSKRWQRAMVGHAVSNSVPVVAANRIGTEAGQTFYGSSFIANPAGNIVAELGRTQRGIISATFDLDEIARERAAWGFFRDRRPDLYGPLTE